jgi:ACS family hexuronate transporter-like MFS transporter
VVTNVEYSIVDEFSSKAKNNEAIFLKEKNIYQLKNKKGETKELAASHVLQKEDKKVVINREGIAYDLGIIDKNTTPDEASKKAKGILGTITIFFMIAYGVSQLFSGKLYDKIGTRKGFVISAAIWGLADALTSLQKEILSYCFQNDAWIGRSWSVAGSSKKQCRVVSSKGESFCTRTF